MIAEPVPVGGDSLLLGLVTIFLVFAALLAVVVLGFVLATKAGDGSRAALTWWAVVLAVEAMAFGVTAWFLLQNNAPWALTVVPVIVALQVSLFLLVRRSIL